MIANIKKTLENKKYLDSITIISLKYYKFLDIFFREKVDKLSLR